MCSLNLGEYLSVEISHNLSELRIKYDNADNFSPQETNTIM